MFREARLGASLPGVQGGTSGCIRCTKGGASETIFLLDLQAEMFTRPLQTHLISDRVSQELLLDFAVAHGYSRDTI